MKNIYNFKPRWQPANASKSSRQRAKERLKRRSLAETTTKTKIEIIFSELSNFDSHNLTESNFPNFC